MARLHSSLRKEMDTRQANLLESALGLRTVEDLLRHYPRRYVEPGQLTDIAELVEGDDVTVVARVRSAQSFLAKDGKKYLVKVVITDGASDLDLAFFAPQKWRRDQLLRQLAPGRRAMFAGRVGSYRQALQLVHPEYHEIEAEADDGDLARRAQERIAIYRTSGSLTSWKLSTLIRKLLDTLAPQDVPDPIPDHLIGGWGLPTLFDTFGYVHRPTSSAQQYRADARLRYEEAFVLQLALGRRRRLLSGLQATPYPVRAAGLLDAFDAVLPFPLTDGQHDVGRDISGDLAATVPMNRLLQGEVGSGKTIVALRAMLQVLDHGAQAALLAPTEVLAAQHHRSLAAHLSGVQSGAAQADPEPARAPLSLWPEQGVKVTLLTGALGAPARRAALDDVRSGAARIVVGTHALIQESVEFADLGLAVIDEQHRFGVEQRDALRAKAGVPPHVLVMTATPIPRSIAMTVFGDLELSTLAELPPGRMPVTTQAIPMHLPKYVKRCWEKVREEVDAGRQVYVVCPRIGDAADPPSTARAGIGADADEVDGVGAESGAARMTAALDVLDWLQGLPLFVGVRFGLLHGRLTGPEKESVMVSFAAGDVDVLVATTVVEVGVDVPNASTMVIMDADRFGLSQLHQLRGRVGRGRDKGYCFLVSGAEDPARQERLLQLAETSDGFAVADLDLVTRREGDVLGAAQSGTRSSLRKLRVTRDGTVIARARADATSLLDEDPELLRHPLLALALAALDDEREAYLDRG